MMLSNTRNISFLAFAIALHIKGVYIGGTDFHEMVSHYILTYPNTFADAATLPWEDVLQLSTLLEDVHFDELNSRFNYQDAMTTFLLWEVVVVIFFLVPIGANMDIIYFVGIFCGW